MNTQISLMRIRQLFEFDKCQIKIDNYSKVIFNLNSLLGSLYYKGMEDELSDDPVEVERFSALVEMTISNAFRDLFRYDKRFYLCIGTKPSSNKKYVADWDKTTNSLRYESKLFKKITNTITLLFSHLASQTNNVYIINTYDLEPCVFIRYFLNRNKSDDTLLISRDQLDLLNLRDGLHIFDGLNIFKSSMNHLSNKLPHLHCNLIPYYLYLVGIRKHDYKGVKGYAKKSALSYLYKNSEYLSKDTMFDNDVFKKIFKLDLVVTENLSRLKGYYPKENP